MDKNPLFDKMKVLLRQRIFVQHRPSRPICIKKKPLRTAGLSLIILSLQEAQAVCYVNGHLPFLEA